MQIIKDKLKAFDDLKNKQKAYEVIYTSFDMQKYIYSENLFNSINWFITVYTSGTGPPLKKMNI